MSGIDARERALAELALALAERASAVTCPPDVRADLDPRLLGPWTDVREVTIESPAATAELLMRHWGAVTDSPARSA